MSPEQVAAVFEYFVQVDTTSTQQFGGTGLGLTITRKFCRMPDGDITVTSELGKGSTFVAELAADARLLTDEDDIPRERATGH